MGDAGNTVAADDVLARLPAFLRRSPPNGGLHWPTLVWADHPPTVSRSGAQAAPMAFVPGLRVTAAHRPLIARAALGVARQPVRTVTATLSGRSAKQILRASVWRRSGDLLGTTAVIDPTGEPSWVSPFALAPTPGGGTPPDRRWSPEEARRGCTAVIITQDRRDQLVAAIRSLEPVCADVVVVDGGSQDGSVEAARSAGAQVVVRTFDRNFAAQRNFGIDVARRAHRPRWILRFDSDELMPSELAAALTEFMCRDGAYDALYVPFLTFGGSTLWEELGLVPLLFRPERRFVGALHEKLDCRRPVFLPIGTTPLLNMKTERQVWESISLYDEIQRGRYDPDVRAGSCDEPEGPAAAG